MAIPIIHEWQRYFSNPDEGLGSSYERIILNKMLEKVIRNWQIKSVLEVPNFGFTGLSGINSMGMAKDGLNVHVCEHDLARLTMIQDLWNKTQISASIHHTPVYHQLDFADQSMDLSWNFSAIWFVDELQPFLAELSRITSKVILICVPNQQGIGYMSQKYLGADDLKKYLHEGHIVPANIESGLTALGWHKLEHSYIDCPPWPDIGMPKEKFARRLGIKIPEKEAGKPITILDFYQDIDLDFDEKMLSYAWLEKYAPDCFKQFWAHHQYLLFIKK